MTQISRYRICKFKRAVVKWILRVTLTPVLASHWLAQFLVSNERLELAYESLSKSTLQRPFEGLLILERI